MKYSRGAFTSSELATVVQVFPAFRVCCKLRPYLDSIQNSLGPMNCARTSPGSLKLLRTVQDSPPVFVWKTTICLEESFRFSLDACATMNPWRGVKTLTSKKS